MNVAQNMRLKADLIIKKVIEQKEITREKENLKSWSPQYIS